MLKGGPLLKVKNIALWKTWDNWYCQNFGNVGSLKYLPCKIEVFSVSEHEIFGHFEFSGF